MTPYDEPRYVAGKGMSEYERLTHRAAFIDPDPLYVEDEEPWPIPPWESPAHDAHVKARIVALYCPGCGTWPPPEGFRIYSYPPHRSRLVALLLAAWRWITRG